MGYHVGGLFTHFIGARHNDFLEMGLHHIVALYLFGGCYMYNLWEVGATIAFLHDLADITTSSTKVWSETNEKKYLPIQAALHLFTWGYTRICILPYMIVNIYLTKIPVIHDFVTIFFCWLLTCMFFLHVYWFKMFIDHLMNFVNKGVVEDFQNKVELETKNE